MLAPAEAPATAATRRHKQANGTCHRGTGNVTSSSSSSSSSASGRTVYFSIVAIFRVLVTSSAFIEVGAVEYCLPETFNVTCAADELILMTSAVYGRMRSNRCIKPDYGHMGCQADVTPFFDDNCSGRRRCEVPVSKLLSVATPCPPDVTSYMDAEYTCVKVPPPSTRCNPDGYAPLTDHQDGHIPLSAPLPLSDSSSPGTQPHHIGGALSQPATRRCPWLVAVDPNQRIEFAVLAFGLQPQYDDSSSSATHVVSSALQHQQHGYQGQSAPSSPSSSLSGRQQQLKQPCAWSLVFEEEGGGTSTGGGETGSPIRRFDMPLCRITGRQTQVYTSTTSRVVIYLMTHKASVPPLPGNFILRYEAIGCPRLKVPENVWIKQDRTTARVKCNVTEETWFLACNGRRWTGELGNCTAPPQGDAESGAAVNEYGANYSTTTSLPYGFLMAVVIGVLLGIVIGAIPLGLVYICLRRKWKRHSPIYDPDAGYGYGVTTAGVAGDLRPCSNGIYYPQLQHVIHQTSVSTAADCSDDMASGRSGFVYPGLCKSSGKTPVDSPDEPDIGFRSATTLGRRRGSSDPFADEALIGGESGQLCNCRTATSPGCHRHHQYRTDCVLVDPTMVDASGTILRTFAGGRCGVGGVRQEHVYESASFARAAAAAAAAERGFDVVGSLRYPPSVPYPPQRTPGHHQTAGVYYEVDAETAVTGDKSSGKSASQQQVMSNGPSSVR